MILNEKKTNDYMMRKNGNGQELEKDITANNVIIAGPSAEDSFIERYQL